MLIWSYNVLYSSSGRSKSAEIARKSSYHLLWHLLSINLLHYAVLRQFSVIIVFIFTSIFYLASYHHFILWKWVNHVALLFRWTIAHTLYNNLTLFMLICVISVVAYSMSKDLFSHPQNHREKLQYIMENKHKACFITKE